MNLTIKGVRASVYKKLKKLAERKDRSLNSEVIDILESAVEGEPMSVKDLLKAIKEVHARSMFLL